MVSFYLHPCSASCLLGFEIKLGSYCIFECRCYPVQFPGGLPAFRCGAAHIQNNQSCFCHQPPAGFRHFTTDTILNHSPPPPLSPSPHQPPHTFLEVLGFPQGLMLISKTTPTAPLKISEFSLLSQSSTQICVNLQRSRTPPPFIQPTFITRWSSNPGPWSIFIECKNTIPRSPARNRLKV
jgi:hypothetical protein